MLQGRLCHRRGRHGAADWRLLDTDQGATVHSTVQYSTVQNIAPGVPVHLGGQLVGAAGLGGGPARAGRGAAPARLRGLHRAPGTGEQRARVELQTVFTIY